MSFFPQRSRVNQLRTEVRIFVTANGFLHRQSDLLRRAATIKLERWHAANKQVPVTPYFCRAILVSAEEAQCPGFRDLTAAK